MQRIGEGRSIHVSWLVALTSLTFVVGVWSALYLVLSFWWLPVIGSVCVGLSFWRKQIYMLPLLVVGSLAVGVVYGSITRGELSVYQPLIGQEITLVGRVKEDPVIDTTLLVLQLDSIIVAEHRLAGSVWLTVVGKPDIKRGDEVVVVGELRSGFGTFAGVMYRAEITSITRPSPGDIGRVVRDWFAAAVRLAIPEPEASLGIGFLTGQKSALPSDLSEALQIAGLTHIVVASGYNLTILVRLSRRLFMRISKFVAAMSSGFLVVCFMAITGLSPSMTRAGLVSGLSLAVWYYGRQFHPFVLLPFAAAITVAIQPSYVWGDLGWQLSFAAFAGVMVIAPLLQRFFFGDTKPNTIRQILGETVAAHFITVPIVVLAFGVLSNVAIPANLAIVPLVPLAMLLTFISGIAGLVAPSLAEWVGLPAYWLLSYMTFTAEYLAALSWSQMTIKVEWWMGIVYYVLLFGACIAMWRSTKLDLRQNNLIE